ncbi:protein STICHEL [Forsythia ovata]|uniref:Protein STICHEL n=1 Tax=Forsythia ovata TaxID=205694 RepID=A0ABD1QD30_9LAMI
MESLTSIDFPLQHLEDELNREIKALKINEGTESQTDDVRRISPYPISPSLLHNSSFATNFCKDSIKTMCAQPKLIPDISPGQSSWTAKVVVAEKNIARTAQRSPVKYQTMVLVDPQIFWDLRWELCPGRLCRPKMGQNLTSKKSCSSTKGMAVSTKSNSSVLINPSFEGVHHLRIWAAANKERLDEIVAQKSYLESSMLVKVCPPAKHRICKIKDIPVTSSFIQAIRTSIDEEQILYVRATERDAEGTIVKYDVVYMFDPVTELDEPLVPSNAANNIVKSQPEHISRINKGKQIVKPVQRALFSLKDSDSSQGEEDGMPSATAIFNHSSRDRVSTIVTSSSEEDNVPP